MQNQLCCQQCHFSQLCLPYSFELKEIEKLDDIIVRKNPYHRRQRLFEAGQPLHSLYAVRSGSFKSFILSEDGQEQITAFHLPGDVIGFDAIHNKTHPSFAEALETSMVCELPYSSLDELGEMFPKLRQQLSRTMSGMLCQNQEALMVLNKYTANERLSHFLASLGHRFGDRGFSPTSFRLSMTRSEIGNYLGLSIETVSRILTQLQKDGKISVEGKLINLLVPTLAD
ncbi:fumarate/nitrate reduction transcriptional regulator Fnr [Neptunicella marina]|uniref:Fumarate/nitrate reduction transcriptional regulator Fnr n=1 Tax=Neptunicella marina TaxID=2125989 RepID=A0A8J6IVE4_9ALTE|nr:fumarate/nitrate reduction transcriptional regulator Fnr [Neptunicella marina]MBC3766939.1 fumarate/nitrate reduction transcriptional regulator Fnr [Neptunicella marina]